MNIKSKVLNKAKAAKAGIKKGASVVGKALDKHFIEPSRRVNRIYNEKMEEMDRKAKAGEFNY
jgi:hypothetical protein